MSAPVDIDNLNMLKDLIGDDLKEILQAYLDTAPDLLIKIDQAVNLSDAEALRLHSHSLKGSSANIGANDLSAHCAELEMMAKNNSLSNAANKAAEIKSNNAVVSEFLQSYMAQM